MLPDDDEYHAYPNHTIPSSANCGEPGYSTGPCWSSKILQRPDSCTPRAYCPCEAPRKCHSSNGIISVLEHGPLLLEGLLHEDNIGKSRREPISNYNIEDARSLPPNMVWGTLMHIYSQSDVVGVVKMGYLLVNPRSTADEPQTIVDKRIMRHSRVDECL